MKRADRSTVEEQLVAELRREERAAAPPDAVEAARARIAGTAQVSRPILSRGTALRAPRGRMSRFTILGLAAVLGIVAAALATAGSHAPDQIVSPPSTPPPSPEASGSFRVGQTIDLGITPQSVAAGLGSVWVAGVQDVYRTESQLLRVDPTTHSITRLPTKFSQCGSFDEWHTFGVGFESIWVPDCARSTLLRVNPQTGAIEATFTGVTRKASNEPESIVAFDASAAWIVRDGAVGTIARVDPATNKVTPFVTLGKRITNIVADGSAVWASNTNSISRIDITTHDIKTTSVSAALGSTALVGKRVVGWLGGDQGSGRVLFMNGLEAPNSFPVTAGPIYGVVQRDGLLWAVSDRYSVVAIDLQQRGIVASVPIDHGDGGIAADSSGLWVGLPIAKQLVEVVPR